jgi:glycerophosphoryl diester phosphodiesterase
MTPSPRTVGFVACAVACTAAVVLGQQGSLRKISIAHRGASAYAPEHTLAAYRLAVEQGADYVEQDLAITRDGVLICLHDDTLERTTNVEDLFPDRARVDPSTGRRGWQAVDFTLAEIKQLDAGSWFDARFARERVPTWDEAVAALGPDAALYPELKTPALYREQGMNMARVFADSVRGPGFAGRRRGALVVQSFDEPTLRELARLLPEVPRTLLIEPADGSRWLSADGLAEAATFATGIGPSKTLLDGRADLVRAARAAGLAVTPYTFTTRGPSSRFRDVRDEMAYYLFDLGVDGLFTDNPDRFPR